MKLSVLDIFKIGIGPSSSHTMGPMNATRLFCHDLLDRGLLDATRDWFRIYKIPTGKPANSFAQEGKYFDREFALKQIEHDHQAWSNLIGGGYDAEPERVKGISLLNSTQQRSRVASLDEATKIVAEASQEYVPEPAYVDQLPIDTVHYLDRSKI